MFALNAIFPFKSPFLFVFCGICAIVEGVEEAVAGAGIVQQQVVRRPKAPNVAASPPTPAPVPSHSPHHVLPQNPTLPIIAHQSASL